MSRGQQGQVFKTGAAENKNFNNLADTSFNAAQNDVTDYGSALAAFKAANPYVTGGAAETAVNQELADTAAGQAESAGQAIQGSAVRTGQNPAGAIAATEDIAARNTRALSGEEAAATERRLAAGTGYGEAVLGATGEKEKMQADLAKAQGGLAQGALGTEEQAAQTPSFMDQLGTGIIQAGDQFAGAFGKKLAGG